MMKPCNRWSKFVRLPLASSPSTQFEDSAAHAAAAGSTPMDLCAQVGSRGAAAFCAPEGCVAAAVLGKGCSARSLSRSLFHATYPNYLPHDTTPRTYGAGPGCADGCPTPTNRMLSMHVVTLTLGCGRTQVQPWAITHACRCPIASVRRQYSFFPCLKTMARATSSARKNWS
jgi:hypothetical protein